MYKTSRLGITIPILVLLVSCLSPCRVHAQVYEDLHDFVTNALVSSPAAGMIQAPDGNFYGTSLAGGQARDGSVFEMTPSGLIACLHSFNGADGESPNSGLTLGSDGEYYGTTSAGGENSDGVAYKITQAGTYTLLHSFSGSDGSAPVNPPAQGTDGYLYGVTSSGGANGDGVFYRISSSGAYTALYSFTGGTDGSAPDALVQGSGFFYGTTNAGGTNGDGVVYAITTSGVVTPLHQFDGGDGADPSGALAFGSDGNLYGTTSSGGSNSLGSVFVITTGGQFNLLHSFAGNDGAAPVAGLVKGTDNNFYGCTSAGGASYVSPANTGDGSAYMMTPAGVVTTLHSFSGADGLDPTGALVQGSDGKFYGTTRQGGANGAGTAFNVSTSGIFSSLTAFEPNDGFNPVGALIQGVDGNFYGTTAFGGAFAAGVLFRMTPAGILYPLYTFGVSPDGQAPKSALIQLTDGSLLGTTFYGGADDYGTIFDVSLSGSETIKYSFTNGTDGEYSLGGLTAANDGNYYGPTSSGGSSHLGNIYRYTPGGSVSSIYQFSGSDGEYPDSTLTLGTDGNLYGVTANGGANSLGTVFKITTGGSFTSVYSFTGGNDGSYPFGSLVGDANNNFYGVCQAGGPTGAGTIFKITSAGVLTPLYQFAGPDGSYPYSGLVLGPDGNYYGTTESGGANNDGTIFEMTPGGSLTTILSFDGANGSSPMAPLNVGSDGTIYGSTTQGTAYGNGNIFALAVPPGAPTIISAVGGNGQVVLTWTAGQSGTSYNVYRSTSSGGEPATPSATGITTTTFTNVGLTNGTTYYFKVAAVNGAGTSNLSGEVSAIPESAIPAAPTGLTATGGNTQIILGWNSSSGATSYSVYRGTSPGGEATAAVATGVPSATYTDTGLTNGTTYYYKVAAVNGAGTSNLSAEAFATPEPAIPTAPTGLTATGGNAEIILGWNSSSGATSYSIYRGTSSGHEGATAILTGLSATTYTDTGLTNVTTYYYKVAAVNGAGTSNLSVETSATPEPAIPPAPTGLTATGGNSQVTLEWGPSSGATSYSIYRGTSSGAESTTPITSGLSSTAYTDTGLTNGTTYYYKFAAANSAGTSNLSGEAFATPEPAIPPAPTGLTATRGNAQVALAWALSGGATSYNIYRGTSSGGESTAPIASGVSSATYTDTGLTNGTIYYYKVAAVNGAGTSNLSGEAFATPQAGGPPAPAGLTATPGNVTVVLSWSAVPTATSYNVYRGTASRSESRTPVASLITGTTYTDTSVAGGVTYYYYVICVNSAGSSGYSNEAHATPLPSIPAAPSGLSATAGNAQVALGWTASSGATSYSVYRGTTTGGETTVAIGTGITRPSYTDTGLANGTTYYYKVSAVNSGGTSGMSSEVSATPEPPAPPAPTGLVAVSGIMQISLSWTASPTATSYNVYRGTASRNESRTPIATGVTSAGYIDTGLAAGSTCYYYVIAVNASGSSPISSEAHATTAPAVPPAPQGLAAVAGNAQVVLSWTASAGAASYSVYRGTTAGGEAVTPIATGVATTTYTDTTVANGSTYYYTVAAVNAGGTSPVSNEASASPLVIPVPTGVAATAGDQSTTVSWNAVTGATSYNLYELVSGSYRLVTNTTATAYTVTRLVNGTSYTFEVAAVGGGHTSPNSTPVSATP